jgi:hypothetical protein
MRTEHKFSLDAQSIREGEKVCAKCGRWGSLAEFPPNASASSGRSSWCSECHRAAVRAWRQRNRDEENRRRRARYAAKKTTRTEVDNR